MLWPWGGVKHGRQTLRWVRVRLGPLLTSTGSWAGLDHESLGVVSNAGVVLCESLPIPHSATCLWFSLY